MSAPRRPWVWLIVATVVLAAFALGLFGVLHALAIVPIWWQLLGGFPQALMASAAIAWIYAELRRVGRLEARLSHALTLGAALWLAILPTTAVDALVRLAGWHRRSELFDVPMAVATAALSGLAAAYLLRLPWPLKVAAPVAVTLLVVSMSGPLRILHGARPRLLLAGFLPLYLLVTTALMALDRMLGLAPAIAGDDSSPAVTVP